MGKGGSKLHEVKPDAGSIDGVWLRGRKVSAKGWEPWMIAGTLASMPGIGRPVVDRTGLKGLFEFRLDFSTTPLILPMMPSWMFFSLRAAGATRLEVGQPSRGPVETFVIDHLEEAFGELA